MESNNVLNDSAEASGEIINSQEEPVAEESFPYKPMIASKFELKQIADAIEEAYAESLSLTKQVRSESFRDMSELDQQIIYFELLGTIFALGEHFADILAYIDQDTIKQYAVHFESVDELALQDPEKFTRDYYKRHRAKLEKPELFVLLAQGNSIAKKMFVSSRGRAPVRIDANVPDSPALNDLLNKLLKLREGSQDIGLRIQADWASRVLSGDVQSKKYVLKKWIDFDNKNWHWNIFDPEGKEFIPTREILCEKINSICDSYNSKTTTEDIWGDTEEEVVREIIDEIRLCKESHLLYQIGCNLKQGRLNLQHYRRVLKGITNFAMRLRDLRNGIKNFVIFEDIDRLCNEFCGAIRLLKGPLTAENIVAIFPIANDRPLYPRTYQTRSQGSGMQYKYAAPRLDACLGLEKITFIEEPLGGQAQEPQKNQAVFQVQANSCEYEFYDHAAIKYRGLISNLDEKIKIPEKIRWRYQVEIEKQIMLDILRKYYSIQDWCYKQLRLYIDFIPHLEGGGYRFANQQAEIQILTLFQNFIGVNVHTDSLKSLQRFSMGIDQELTFNQDTLSNVNSDILRSLKQKLYFQRLFDEKIIEVVIGEPSLYVILRNASDAERENFFDTISTNASEIENYIERIIEDPSELKTIFKEEQTENFSSAAERLLTYDIISRYLINYVLSSGQYTNRLFRTSAVLTHSNQLRHAALQDITEKSRGNQNKDLVDTGALLIRLTEARMLIRINYMKVDRKTVPSSSEQTTVAGSSSTRPSHSPHLFVGEGPRAVDAQNSGRDSHNKARDSDGKAEDLSYDKAPEKGWRNS